MHTKTFLVREAIYEYILRSGAAGLTDQEIARHLQLSPQLVQPRRIELVRARRVMAMHPRRRVGGARAATVWLATGVVAKLLVRQ